MKTRLIAGIVAVVLAAVGSVVLVSYVRGADARAMAGLSTVDVLVAAEAIPQGTPAADLNKLVDTKQLPANAVLPNRVTTLDQLAGTVALLRVDPGEQLLETKFGAPPTADPDAVVIPPKMQQITVLLELQRAMGGYIKAGDTVGIFVSVKDSKQTHLTAHKVLVTKVQQAPAEEGGQPSEGGQPAPPDLEGKLLVTVATTPAIAEKIAFAAEPDFGSIWLSNEPLTADESGTQVIDGTTVFK